MSANQALIDRFVATFERAGRLSDPDVPPEMSKDPAAQASGWSSWRPIRYPTTPGAVSSLYAHIPGPLPPLFELLLTSYRWLEVDLKILRLLPNPPGKGLDRFAVEVLSDEALSDYLVPRQLVRFGKGTNANYDPVCFDLRRKLEDGDCAILQLDHEDILQGAHPVKTRLLAPSFATIVSQVINLFPSTPL